MDSDEPQPDFFQHGTRWVRADFHLHTRADKEFQYIGEPNSFVKEYVARLVAEDVRVGVMTNHNKFDRDEFRALSRAARRENIFLLPGVELSADDGPNGIHTLVVFDPDTWLEAKANKDWINDFIDATFHDSGVVNRENENQACAWRLKRLLQELHNAKDKHGRDSFVVMAHVEDRCGLFKRDEGGRVAGFGDNAHFEEFVLGFQKVRTFDQIPIWKQWLGNDLPAFVEGSDCKGMAKVGGAHESGGEEKRCYLHVGAFTFEAVKLALLNHKQRVATAPLDLRHAHIHTLIVEGSGNDGVQATWHLNCGLNTLIGIRGSGKSTLLELIRYGLGMELKGFWGNEAADGAYKNGLVQSHLGSGGKVRVLIRCKTGNQHEVRRIYGETPKVYQDGKLVPNLRPIGGLLDVLYFGQKDLSELGREERNPDLIEKFYAEDLRDARQETQTRADDVQQLAVRLSKQNFSLERRGEFQSARANAEQSLRVFEEKKVADKLRRQVAFQNDLALLTDMDSSLSLLAEGLRDLRDERAEDFDDFVTATSTENPAEIVAAQTALEPARAVLAQLTSGAEKLGTVREELNGLRVKLQAKQQDLAEEFAAIRREIGETDGHLNPDFYVDLQRRLRVAKQSLEELDRQEITKQKGQTALANSLESLRQAWHEEFQVVQKRAEAVNARELPIRLELVYRGNKERFAAYLRDLVQGTGIRAETVARVAAEFIDPIEIYQAMETNGDTWQKAVPMGSSRQSFEARIRGKLAEFLTFRVPDRLELTLRGRPLSKQSLGQRTSALVLFLLEKGGYDLLLIDQPEDDLDNQTIYQDVIKRLRELKHKHQFVFATHNANIPVLGEAEMVAACAYTANGDKFSMKVQEGSTDKHDIQQAIISVMEGGDEAFRLRNQIYEQWRH